MIAQEKPGFRRGPAGNCQSEEHAGCGGFQRVCPDLSVEVDLAELSGRACDTDERVTAEGLVLYCGG
jgi:hypothetical protein